MESASSHERKYSTNLQLICDDRGFIRYYIVCYTGPTPGNEIISKSWILKTPEKIFSFMEYLLADAGYGLRVLHIDIP